MKKLFAILSLIILFAFNLYSQSECPSGMISYWKLDETSGNVYDDYIGTNNAASTNPPRPIIGLVGGAQNFNGTSEKITVPRIPGYDFAANSGFTFEVWVKHPAKSIFKEEIIIERKPSSGNLVINLKIVSGKVNFNARNITGQYYTVSGNKNLYDGKWHHIVGVRDAVLNQLRIYVDGILENRIPATYTAGFASSSAVINIGWRDKFLEESYFYGLLDEVAVYNVALDSALIKQHYNNGLQNKAYCEQDPVGYISVTPDNREAGPLADSTTFDVSSDVSWETHDDADWCQVDPDFGNGNGTITATFAANPLNVSRVATIKVIGGGQTRTVKVTQQGKLSITVINPNGGEIWHEGEKRIITWTDNIPENVSISLYSIDGEGEYLYPITSTESDGNYLWTIPADIPSTIIGYNNEKIMIKSINNPDIIDYSDGYFSIGHDEEINLTVTPASREVGNKSGSTTFDVSSNTSWETHDDADWCQVDPDLGSGNGTIKVTFNENSTAVSRKATIQVVVGGLTRIVTVTQQGGTICPSTILSYWKLDETSGNVYYDNAGINNAASSNVPKPIAGKVNGAQQFNGITNKITAPGIAAYDFDFNSGFTVEAWINHPSVSFTKEEVIIERKPLSGNLVINLKFSSNKPTFNVRNIAGQFFSVTGTKNLYDGTWHHIVGVRDAALNQLRIYVDGVLENTTTAAYTAGFASSNTGISIGWRNKTGDESYFKGSIDEVAIYNSALDIYAVARNYYNGLQSNGYCSGEPNHVAPVITTYPEKYAVLGQLYTYDCDAVGYPVPTYEFGGLQPPDGMTIDQKTGIINWVPSETGIYSACVYASSDGKIKSQCFNIWVINTCPEEIISYWTLNKFFKAYGFNDEKGIRFVGGSIESIIAGQIEGAVQFNSDYLIADAYYYNFRLNDSFSIEFWIRRNGLPSSKEVAIDRDDGWGNSLWWVGVAANGKAAFSLSSSGVTAYIEGSVITDGNWHQIVATRDGVNQVISIYVDGVIRNSKKQIFTSGFTAIRGYISLGAHIPVEFPLHGALDEVALYKVSLSNDVILKHYNNGLAGLGYCTGLAKSVASVLGIFGFKALAEGKNVKLSWQAEENNIKEYEIERESRDNTWTKIGNVKSAEGCIDYQYFDKPIQPEGEYSYRIKMIGKDGSNEFSEVAVVKVLPKEFKLFQNYPNPFNPSTTIKFGLPEDSNVKLVIFGILGNEIATLVNEKKPSGNYEVIFDGSNLSNGIYICRLQAGNFVQLKKMVLLK